MDVAPDNTTGLFPVPSDDGIIAFLAGDFIKGIGKTYARRIVETLGNNAIDKIIANPGIIKDVPGIGPSKVNDLISSLQSLKYPYQLLLFLYSAGLSSVEIEKILSHYGKLASQVILYDPYEMVEDVWKFSFFSADKIGKALGIKLDDPRRLRGALLTAVKLYCEMGHVFATKEQAVTMASRITGVDETEFMPQLSQLIADERLISSHNGIYLPVYYRAEKEGAEKLSELAHSHLNRDFPGISQITDREGHELSAAQIDAVNTVLNNPVTIITGGPGTGKTTVIKGIIEQLESQGMKVVLAAPTGRAAKRMTELTGTEAKTIHRLLGYRPGEGYKNKKFDADILIIDEASMMEQVLFNHLLQALKPHTKIVMVGDIDQLPPIGAGDVLRDMIASGTVPVITLTENFRQQQGSDIAANAMEIRAGKYPSNFKTHDFAIVYEKSLNRIHQRLLDLVASEIPLKFHIDPKDIQVVTPMQDGPLGSKQLNIDIQQRVNPDGPEIRKITKVLRLGDRVMQTSNSSSRGIYNGETGWVSAVYPEQGELEVTFHDGKTSIYTRSALGELSLAYAITVHKLQGSETDYLVMPMTMTHQRHMLYRNLLYTAVSRARKLCVLVGEKKAIETALRNETPVLRNSNFRHRLRERLRAS